MSSFIGMCLQMLTFLIVAIWGFGPGESRGDLPMIFVPQTVLWGCVWFCFFRFRYRSGVPGVCRCGYSLVGNTSGVCPECGTPTTQGDAKKPV
jgi:hypothetical protein